MRIKSANLNKKLYHFLLQLYKVCILKTYNKILKDEHYLYF